MTGVIIPWKIQTKKDGTFDIRGVYRGKEYLVECSLHPLNADKNVCMWSAWLFGENWTRAGEDKFLVDNRKTLRDVLPLALAAFEETILSPMDLLVTGLQ